MSWSEWKRNNKCPLCRNLRKECSDPQKHRSRIEEIESRVRSGKGILPGWSRREKQAARRFKDYLRYSKRPIERHEYKSFLVSKEWQILRYTVLRNYGRTCMACGETEGVMHVDHVKPVSRYPWLMKDLSNLQVLCRDCNLGKGAWDETDWRETKSEMTNDKT